MSFIPLSEILKRLSKSFLDQDCKKQCENAQLNQKVVEMPDGSWEASTDSTDFCIKVENNHFDCRDPAVRTKDFCIEQCKAGLPTCTVEDTRKLPCSSLLREEEKWNRRVEALETAVEMYITNAGGPVGDNLVIQDNFVIPAGSTGCTHAYNGQTDAVDEVR